MKFNIKRTLVLFLVSFSLAILVFSIYIFVQVAIYLNFQHKNYLMKDECNSSEYTEKQRIKEPKGCYNRMYSLLLPELLIYNVKFKDNRKVEFYAIDSDSSYLVPHFVTKDSDALIGYGVGQTCHFEDNFAKFFQKRTYAFDCAHNSVPCINAQFEPECIATDKYMLKDPNDYWVRKRGEQISSGKIHYFKDKLKQLKLSDKKVYLKMDIAGAEDEALPEILENSDNIVAISVIMHIDNAKNLVDKIETLKLLNEKFFLVTRRDIAIPEVDETIKKRHRKFIPLKYMKGIVDTRLSLTYINKNLVDKYYIPLNQDSNESHIELDPYIDNVIYYPESGISWVVVVADKFKKWFDIDFK